MPNSSFVFVLALAASGCATGVPPGPCEQFQSGSNISEPCQEQLYFPTGIAMDTDGDVLYVTNYNADLRYSGSSVQSIDVAHYACVLEYVRTGIISDACKRQQQPIFTDPAGSQRVVGLGDDLSGQPGAPADAIRAACPLQPPLRLDQKAGAPPWLEVNTLVAAEAACCTFDLLDPNIIECDERPFITSAVKTGNFAGTIRVQSFPTPPATMTTRLALPIGPSTPCPPGTSQVAGTDDTCAGPAPADRRLWLPVRGDNSLTWIDVDKPYRGGHAGSPTPSVARLACTDPGNSPGSGRLDSCNGQRITVRDFHNPVHPNGTCAFDVDCPQYSTCDTSLNVCSVLPIPQDPFGLWLDEGEGLQCDSSGANCRASHYSHLLVTHLQGGEVTLINAGAFSPISTAEQPPPVEPIVLDVRTNFFTADPTTGNFGGFAVAPLTPGDPNSFWFVTSRVNATIGVFRVSDEELVLPTVGFSLLGGAYGTGDDVRDIQVQPDGTRAFLIDNHPPTVFTLDTRPLLQGGQPVGTPTDQVTDIVDVCLGPSHLQLRQFTVPGAPGEPDAVATRLYAVCFTDGQVWVVDPDERIVTARISVGAGPNDIAFNFPSPAGSPLRGYVTNFTDSTIAVIDLEPGSPTENRVIGRIGITSPPFTPPSDNTTGALL